MELTQARSIENYTTALSLAGKSPETILWCRKKLTGFETFMQNGGTLAKVRSLTLDDGRSFIKSLMYSRLATPITASATKSKAALHHSQFTDTCALSGYLPRGYKKKTTPKTTSSKESSPLMCHRCSPSP